MLVAILVSVLVGEASSVHCGDGYYERRLSVNCIHRCTYCQQQVSHLSHCTESDECLHPLTCQNSTSGDGECVCPTGTEYIEYECHNITQPSVHAEKAEVIGSGLSTVGTVMMVFLCIKIFVMMIICRKRIVRVFRNHQNTEASIARSQQQQQYSNPQPQVTLVQQPLLPVYLQPHALNHQDISHQHHQDISNQHQQDINQQPHQESTHHEYSHQTSSGFAPEPQVGPGGMDAQQVRSYMPVPQHQVYFQHERPHVQPPPAYAV